MNVQVALVTQKVLSWLILKPQKKKACFESGCLETAVTELKAFKGYPGCFVVKQVVWFVFFFFGKRFNIKKKLL